MVNEIVFNERIISAALNQDISDSRANLIHTFYELKLSAS